MFNKILIANRGEIACRVIHTARRMGIATVAVYSQADARARHVRLADEAVCIGPAPAAQSYLQVQAILAAAACTGAEAIHPGYGFLSESADFAHACERDRRVFIGPPASAIRAMGSKSAAKALMAQAGVPLTPGYHGSCQTVDFLQAQADAIGYPVLIKASAGGGGKGMRRVERASDFVEALAACQREARHAFGDDQVLIEQYVLQPRHIEVQVFADQQGHVVSLFERDCSVQRRHQKVLEEAPAPGMTPAQRAAMARAAVDAARAVGYVGAGTVEFIVTPQGAFHFMEMNTRLQVEHPVTEMITGLDLVEWQLRVAAGEPLPLTQEAIRFEGHAMEARVYAEDPDRGFLPATGRLWHLVPPPTSAHVRVDTGVEAGDEITPHYDPMIAKLIVWDRDRDRALRRLRQALAQYRVIGVANNLAFLQRLVATPAFERAALDTGLIERERALLFPVASALISAVPDAVWAIASLAALWRDRAAGDGWRLNAVGGRVLYWQQGDQVVRVRAVPLGEGDAGAWSLSMVALQAGDAGLLGEARVLCRRARLDVSGADGAGVEACAASGSAMSLSAHVALDDRRWHVDLVFHGAQVHVFSQGQVWILTGMTSAQTGRQDDSPEGRGGRTASGGLTAPMPGKVMAHLIPVGTRVEAGAPVLVLEAMKMEHTLHAPTAGVVTDYVHAVGEWVSEGECVLTLQP